MPKPTLLMAAIERHPQRALAVLLGVFVTTALVYASIVPAFDGPDSGGHFRYIAYLWERRQLPRLDAETFSLSYEAVQQPPLYYLACALLAAPTSVAQARDLDIPNPYVVAGMTARTTVWLPGTPWQATLPLWIARWVALAGAVATVVGTWQLLRQALPERPLWALAAASLVALNPRFVYLATTITNDTWAAAFVVLAVGAMQRAVQRPSPSAGEWLGVGAWAGLAALTKYSCLLVAVPLGALWFVTLRTKGWERARNALLWMACSALLLAGYWYGRNFVLYGQFVPMQPMLAIMPGLARAYPAAWQEILYTLITAPFTYWGVYRSGVVSPPVFCWIIVALTVVSVVGLFRRAVRARVAYRGGRDASESWFPLAALAALWFLAILVSYAAWVRVINYADQGRLLFPAAPAAAILLVCGWTSLLPRRVESWLLLAIPLVFLAFTLWQVPILWQDYHAPAPLAGSLKPDRPLMVRFQAGMTLVGMDLPHGAAIDAHSTMPVTLYWRTESPIDDYYTLYIRLVTEDGRLLYQYENAPAGGRHPTRQWAPGTTFADSYDLRVDAVPDGMAILTVGFYEFGDIYLLQPAVTPDGTVLSSGRVEVARVRLHSAARPARPTQSSAVAHWQGGISLLGTEVMRGDRDAARTLALLWHASQNVHTDYTVSVQVLGRDGQLLVQQDHEPQQGQYPTSAWRAGDVIDDEYAFPDWPADWQKIIVLMYDRAMRRLPLSNAPGGDYWVLQERP